MLKLAIFSKLKALGWGKWEKLFAISAPEGQSKATLLLDTGLRVNHSSPRFSGPPCLLPSQLFLAFFFSFLSLSFLFSMFASSQASRILTGHSVIKWFLALRNALRQDRENRSPKNAKRSLPGSQQWPLGVPGKLRVSLCPAKRE